MYRNNLLCFLAEIWLKKITSRDGCVLLIFSRRFQEGISFPNFVERSILELPLSKLCAVPFALQNRALFKGDKRAKCAEKKGGKGVASKVGKKKKGRVKTGQENSSASTGKKRGLVYTRKLVFKGKRWKNIYTKEPSSCVWGTSSHSIGV